jgi:DNA topoisomerase-3
LPKLRRSQSEQVAAARERRSGCKGKGRKGGGAKHAGLGCCHLCKGGEIVETAKAYGCSCYREGCRVKIWKTVAALRLTKKQVGHLIREGHRERIEGFTSKAGEPFAARLKLGEGCKVVFEFPERKRG